MRRRIEDQHHQFRTPHHQYTRILIPRRNNYFDTYSLIAKLPTIKIVFALSSLNKWTLHQLDANNVFWNGEFQDDVYMIVPPSVTSTKSNQVCKLVKSLYKLKQASKRRHTRDSQHFLYNSDTSKLMSIILYLS